MEPWLVSSKRESCVSLRRVVLVLLSAALHGLAFPPVSLWPVAWFALVPLFRGLRGVGPGAAILLGLLWGTAAIWSVGHWVPGALSFYYEQPPWFGVLFALVASVFFAGSYSAGFGACHGLVVPRLGYAGRLIYVPALWVAWELARARLLTGEPWLLLGYALGPAPSLIQAADLGGVPLLSFAIVLVNVALAEGIAIAQPRRLLAIATPPALVIAALLAYGRYRLASPFPNAPAFPVTVIQGNNDLHTQWRQEFYGKGLVEYLRMSVAAGARHRPSLLVWPESAVTFFPARDENYRVSIARTLASIGADLIVGGPHHEGGEDARRYFNSAFYLTSKGTIAGRYDKTHLLPFAEYFPLRTIEFLRRRFERVRYFTAGDEPVLLDTRLGKVAVVICFEGIFPELVREQMQRGARLLVNLSNDAWLGEGAGLEQHLAMVAFRAVENRTWIVRAATTGISAFIDPYGRIVARTPAAEVAQLDGEVVPLDVSTVYRRVGDLFAWACVLGSAITLLAVATRRARVVRTRPSAPEAAPSEGPAGRRPNPAPASGEPPPRAS